MPPFNFSFMHDLFCCSTILKYDKRSKQQINRYFIRKTNFHFTSGFTIERGHSKHHNDTKSKEVDVFDILCYRCFKS